MTGKRMCCVVLHNSHMACLYPCDSEHVLTLQLNFLSLRSFLSFSLVPPLSLSPSLPPDLGLDLTNWPQEAPGPGLVSPGDHLMMMCEAPLSIYLGPVPIILRDDDAMRTTNWSRKL